MFDKETAQDLTKLLLTLFNPNTCYRSMMCNVGVIRDLLIEDQVWGKVEHGAVSKSVGPPAQGEHHHPHP